MEKSTFDVQERLEWRPIPYCPNYFVSNTGLVYSTNNRKRMKQRIGRDGRYLVVDLMQDGKKWYKRVHRLVAEVFIPNPNNLPEVNHIDGNKLNNHVENLEWVDHLENMRHAYRTGLVSGHSKLSSSDIDYIKSHYVQNDPEFGTRGLARKFRVSHSTIRRYLKG